MDIAKIGLSVDTSQVKAGVAAVNQLSAAVQGYTAADIKRLQGQKQITKSTVDQAKAQILNAESTGKATEENIKNLKSALKLAEANDKVAASLLKKAKGQKLLGEASISTERVSAEATLNRAVRGRTRSGFTGADPNGQPRDMMVNRFNTGNIAAQFQDIGVTAAMGMSPLTIALQQGTQLSAIINSMGNPLRGIAAAFTSIINPVSLLSIGIVALVAALIQMTDWSKVTQSILLGLADAVDKYGVSIMAAAVVITAFYIPAMIRGIFTMGVMAVSAVKAAATMALAWIAANPITLIAGLIAVAAAIAVFAVQAVKPIRDFANNFILFFVKAYARVTLELENMLNRMIPLINKFLSQLPSWMGGDVRLKPVFFEIPNTSAQDFVGKGLDAASKLTDVVSGKLKGLAASASKAALDGVKGAAGGKSVSEKTDLETAADQYAEIIKGANKRIDALKLEEQFLGKTALQISKLRFETELLNQAEEKGIMLSNLQRIEIAQLAGQYSNLEASIKRQRETYEFLKDSGRGFVSDLRKNLQEGQNLWQSFGNAVASILDKIANRLLDSGTNLLFDAVFPANDNKKSGGILNSIGGLLGFKKGGVFTNGVYDNPTMFKFAKGGSFGVMGEAGPEAVMPLHRGSDGSLGVKMSGGSSGNVIVNVNNNSTARATVTERQTSNGSEIDIIIDEIVGQKLAEAGTNSNKSLRSFNNRQLTQR